MVILLLVLVIEGVEVGVSAAGHAAATKRIPPKDYGHEQEHEHEREH